MATATTDIDLSKAPATGARRSFLARLVATDDGIAQAIARIALGVVIFPHGAQKLLGWFGGWGFSATVAGFAKMGMPPALTVLVILAESFGALMLVFGALSRFAAASIALVMLGAVALAHAHAGFFMNWMGTKQGEGFEYHLLALGLAAIVVVAGAGKASIDRWLTRKQA